MPLHPAIVHMPIALALLMPALAAGFAWALWTRRIGPRGWIAVVALQALLVGSALVAINTGGAEEDRVERIVKESALERHEEFAEQFAWASGVTLGLTALVLVLRRPSLSGAATAAAVLATVVVAGLGLRVGHAGGQLVYVDGAASAYVSSGSLATGVPSERALGPARTADDDD